MEQLRLFLAIGLSFIVLVIWSMYFGGRSQAPVDPEDAAVSSQQEVAKPETAVEEPPEPIPPVPQPMVPDAEEKQITVRTPYYTATLSTWGATFHAFVLNQYRETAAPDSSEKNLVPQGFTDSVLQSALLRNSLPGLEHATYAVDVDTDEVVVGKEKQTVTFTWVSDKGVQVKKVFGFDPTSYLIDYRVEIENYGETALHDALSLSLRKPVGDTTGYAFTGPSALINNSLEQIKVKKIKDKSEFAGTIQWIANDDGYFIYCLVPETPVDGTMKLAVNDQTLVNELVNPDFEIPPGSRKEFSFYLFMGPKNMDLLNSLGHNLGKALNFGFFNLLAKPFLWVLNKIHTVIPNYGVAIIVLTLFIKILLWPLGNKSYKSMNDMKKLQPLMLELREKYKDDKQRMNQEIMSLYRTYKINPLGGCLPMLLQLPVFFAFYQMLYQAIELRHAPFFLWINDLSAPDRLLQFGFSIPFMAPPYGIPVLTLIMGATMLLQQKMAPPPGDPMQAKMMMLMPIVFTFIFINFSSGLVLYWLVNNVFSICQQYYIQQKCK
ncbi:membrane protein insertase YidC [Desulfosarcina sp. OttesenSCG-928-A07]|nr:membrane protein insertase YidC [Desulfosarcina sp. OttesenSCG-928-G17]MDL2328684.1 membrane protein insertase YidC [Desulfosarcina sp. OttesenSCG-928-A07]